MNQPAGAEPRVPANQFCADPRCGHAPRIHKPGCTWPGCHCSRLVATLSPREWEVLNLLAAGEGAKGAAAALGIAVKTVETHRKSLFSKLGVHSIEQAIAAALHSGALRVEDLPEPPVRVIRLEGSGEPGAEHRPDPAQQ